MESTQITAKNRAPEGVRLLSFASLVKQRFDDVFVHPSEEEAAQREREYLRDDKGVPHIGHIARDLADHIRARNEHEELAHQRDDHGIDAVPQRLEDSAHADADSQGGRLYTCPGCGKYSTWISYDCVDREYQKEELRKYYAEDGLGDRYGNKLD